MKHSQTSRARIFFAPLIAALMLVLSLVIVNGSISASATDRGGDDVPCVPRDAYTETIEHPAVTHEETITVVDEEAYTEVIEATPDLWWNWSPNDTQGAQDYEPAFPVDERGTWQGPHANGGPMQDTYGTFQTSENGNSNWFHREQGVAEQVIEHPAVTHEETIVVTDVEAWTEVIEHPAIVCDEEEDPLPVDVCPSIPGDQPAGTDCNPEVAGEQLEIPAEPGMKDPCGARNATWVVPADTVELDWTLTDGVLSVEITASDTVFQGTEDTTYSFGKVKEENKKACDVGGEQGNDNDNPPLIVEVAGEQAEVPTAVDAGIGIGMGTEQSPLGSRGNPLWLLAVGGGLGLMGSAGLRRRATARR